MRRHQQAEQDEHADLGEPAEPFCETAVGRGVRQFGVAEDHRGEIDGEEAAAVRHGTGPVRHDRDRQDGDRVEAGRGQGHMPQGERAEPAGRESDDRADRQLQRDLADQHVPGVDRTGRGERHHQDHDGGVVETGFRLERSGHPGRQRHFAQHGEDRGGVGRGDDRADDQGLLPRESHQIVGGGGRDADAHRDACRRQSGGRGQRRPDLFPLRAESTFGQDHDEGAVADHLRQFGVVELDVEQAVPADGHADAEIQQQARQPAARGQAHSCHGHEQDQRADEQEFVELVDSQWPILPLAPCGRILVPAGDTSLPYLIFNASLTVR